jgi:hypothetical protein
LSMLTSTSSSILTYKVGAKCTLKLHNTKPPKKTKHSKPIWHTLGE